MAYSLTVEIASIRNRTSGHLSLDWLRARLKPYMERNINGTPRHQRDGSGSTPEWIKTMNDRRLYLALVIRSAVQRDDPSGIVEVLNRSQYRILRDRSDWCEIINNKFPNHSEVHTCEDCDSLEFHDDLIYAYDGDRAVCQSCIDQNYHYSERRETYVHEDDEEEEEDDRLIGEYHSSSERLTLIPSDFDSTKNPIYLGLELEMETRDGDRYNRAERFLDAIGKHKGHQYCLLENDGSLNDGFEMVTGHTSLAVHREQLQFFKTPFSGMKSHDTRTCGLHIHICKTGMTLNHATKLILFINDSGNQKLIRAIARRDGSSYSQVKNKKASYNWLRDAKGSGGRSVRHQLMSLNEDRYEALNFKNQKTVEFRLFKGTLRYESIVACLEFTYASWYFSREAGMTELNTDNFIKFICRSDNRSDTRFLREYLIQKGFNLPTFNTSKTASKSPATASAEV